jgi:hypothetical protein
MGWQFFNAFSSLVSLAVLFIKVAADWIGRTTVPEDASQLQVKAIHVLNWIADKPGLLFYGGSALLFGLFAWQFFQRLGERRPGVIFGPVEMTSAPVGCAMLLPIRVREWQGIPCRVTMEWYRLDGSRVRPSFVLVSEQEAIRSTKRVGRVTLDDTFKRFELFQYDPQRETLHLVTEAGEYTFPVDYYRVLVTVSGAGPARPVHFLLQPLKDGVRLSDGTIRGANEVVFTEPIASTPRPVAPDSPSNTAQALDALFAIGVRGRNRLIPPIRDFDYASERQKLIEWSDLVVEQMGNKFIKPSERSRFRTLDTYDPEPMRRGPITEGQMQVQTIWTEKLKRLRAVIDRIGKD